MIAGKPATLRRLRQEVARIEGVPTTLETGDRIRPFGVVAIDAVLQGGLMPAALHEIAPARMPDLGAACGFAAALAARPESGRRQVLWIQTDFSALESGRPYGPGCDLFGLPTRRLLLLSVPRPVDLLWAMEEALRSRALAAVIGEMPQGGGLASAAADLTATRRLTLAAREGDSLGLLLRHQPSPLTTAAETRWQVAAAPSRPDRFGGLGRTAFTLTLTKNRRGPNGRWLVEWDHHECVFSALSLGVAAAAVDRSDRTPLVRAG